MEGRRRCYRRHLYERRLDSECQEDLFPSSSKPDNAGRDQLWLLSAFISKVEGGFINARLLDLRTNSGVLHMILERGRIILRLTQNALHDGVLEDC